MKILIISKLHYPLQYSIIFSKSQDDNHGFVYLADLHQFCKVMQYSAS